MSMVAVLLAVLLAGGLIAAVRLASENAARQRAELRALELRQKNSELEEMVARAGQHEREWLAVLAHEMRSPVGAILGYGELIGDGTLQPERTADTALRMSRAAEQILALIRGMEYVALINGNDADDPEPVDVAELAHEAVGVLSFEAQSRNATIQVAGSASFTTRREQAALALLLALGAAVKVSAGRTLRITAQPGADGGCVVIISGSALRADADDPAEQPLHRNLSGPGLRIALARSVAGAAGGSVEIRPDDDASDVIISLPELPASH